jgi:hypothetical protein
VPDLPIFPQEPFTWAQARELGITRRRLDRAQEEREVTRLLYGVYLRRDVVLTPLVLARAAALVVESTSVICDRTASWIHGVECFDLAELDQVPPVESYVLKGQDPTDRAECAGGTRDLRPEDWMDIGGVRVTTPLRTALDLGCKLSRRRALGAMDALMRAHEFTRADMEKTLVRYRRRRGVVQLRALVPWVDGLTESQPESWVKLEIADHGLPMPVPQYWIRVAGVPTYRLDFAYPHARVAVEYDGEEFHTSEQDRRADERRRAFLRSRGWTVIVLDRHSFTTDAILTWIGQLRTALRRG